MLKTSITTRPSKLTTEFLAPKPVPLPGVLEIFPRTLAAESLRGVVRALAEAYRKKKPVILCLGSHVIKTGLSPIIIDLMRRGIVTCLAMNGSAIVHDVELSLFGETSEDVEAALPQGLFGVTEETQRVIHKSIQLYGPCMMSEKGYGLGWAVGEGIRNCACNNPLSDVGLSLFAEALRLQIPACVFVGFGTDVYFLHPGASGARIGEASLRDFRTFCEQVKGLGGGGVLLNIGSAVILPEVVLKAVALARSEGISFEGSTFVNLDMIDHYRARKQIVERPRSLQATTYDIRGHHEILLPLITGCLLEEIENGKTIHTG
jgi:hypothetical protein